MLFEALPDVLCFKKLQETLHDADVGRLGKAGSTNLVLRKGWNSGAGNARRPQFLREKTTASADPAPGWDYSWLKQIVDLASDEKRQIRVNVTADASRINVENLKYMNLGIKHTKMNKLLYSLSKIVTIN